MNNGTDTNHAVKTVAPPASAVTDFPGDPSRTGYDFAGWNTRADGSGSSFTVSTTVSDDVTVYARWNPDASVHISLEPQPGNPSLSDAAVFKDASIWFSAAGTGYTAWQWYWNGEIINSAVSDTYTLEANAKQPGIYELSVVVTAAGGEKLSARCRITVKDK
jgi:uncharacterized repeat protein (TIGR02543 family)